MRRPTQLALVIAGAFPLSACSEAPELTVTEEPATILICEQATTRIMRMDASLDWSSPEAVVWSWSPADDPALDDTQRKWFSNPDEAKPDRGGKQIVITASGGGVALIDYATAQATAVIEIGGNPHSADFLPDGRVVVASSTGDTLSLWDADAGEIIQKLTLSDAHGLEWDVMRNCLWALGGKQIQRLHYHPGADPNPLTVESTVDLPVTEASKRHPRHGGHDLTPIPGEDAYFVSDMDHLWRFDPATETFAPLAGRHEMADVKSISQLAKDGPILVLMATQDWHSTGPRTLDESEIWELPGARIYKARWWQE
ncbi:DUF6528 family protein [Haloferula helveola]